MRLRAISFVKGILNKVAEAPLLAMITMTAVGLVAILLTQLLHAPGITMALDLNTRHVEMRLSPNGILLRDINARRISIDLQSNEQKDSTSNNLLSVDQTARTSELTIEAQDGGVARLESLLIKAPSILSLVQYSREKFTYRQNR